MNSISAIMKIQQREVTMAGLKRSLSREVAAHLSEVTFDLRPKGGTLEIPGAGSPGSEDSRWLSK